jgi:hypothetical protein
MLGLRRLAAHSYDKGLEMRKALCSIAFVIGLILFARMVDRPTASPITAPVESRRSEGRSTFTEKTAQAAKHSGAPVFDSHGKCLGYF